ncbi:DUF3888 domain-containing protein [Ectobacillus antri]|uniref:DUF3888 domain-containing protein n=1 Tax=Ectobacillus antri TaxID=2486280 RepID=A0ABT6H2I2_9BACI|nr:DUF3888 domain-containing protein [Ectobacillus antri]MDG4656303.1 DUF3888 domain-containing protein [Ectobacillus antri]MDG5752978.1 DUF3888 domain-containing protein [Ectobacillus antri]
MKKLLIFALFLLSLCVYYIPANAEKQHKHDAKGMEQTIDHLILDQFTDELNQAVANYYKKDTIRIQYNWRNKNYDVVELDQSEKRDQLGHPYVIKFTVQTYDGNKKEQLGTDTVTFGVSPVQFNKEFVQKDLAAVKVALLDYTHVEPSK